MQIEAKEVGRRKLYTTELNDPSRTVVLERWGS